MVRMTSIKRRDLERELRIAGFTPVGGPQRRRAWEQDGIWAWVSARRSAADTEEVEDTRRALAEAGRWICTVGRRAASMRTDQLHGSG